MMKLTAKQRQRLNEIAEGNGLPSSITEAERWWRTVYSLMRLGLVERDIDGPCYCTDAAALYTEEE
jgi:DNA-binding IclR family transcriptional regulator